MPGDPPPPAPQPHAPQPSSAASGIVTDASGAAAIAAQEKRAHADAARLRERAAQARHAAALARVAEADRVAAAAQAERDAAETRLRAALARAALERAATQPLPGSDDGSGGEDSDAGDDPLQDALFQHEAAALINLHAQAVAVQNIRLLVPLVLDVSSTFYGRWRESFLHVVGRYSLESHVLSDASTLTSPDWVRMDYIVRTWLGGTITDALAETAIEPGNTARVSWLAIESQFRGNRETRALHLDAEFRNFKQGDQDITTYCRKLKGMADALRDLGEPVLDRTLVLNLIRGLNGRFEAIGLHLRRGHPFPSFLQARNDLLLEELTMEATAPATALHVGAATPSSGSRPPSAPQAPPAAPPQQRPPGQQQPSNGGGGASAPGAASAVVAAVAKCPTVGSNQRLGLIFINHGPDPSTCGLDPGHRRSRTLMLSSAACSSL